MAMVIELLAMLLCSTALHAGSEPCYSNITKWSGPFSSLNYPSTYAANLDCFWLFKVAPGNLVEIQFRDFALENSDNCERDYVEIRDGPHETSKVLSRMCGSMKTTAVLSSGNTLLLHMHTDAENHERGFAANHQGICRVTLTASSGAIASPNYPSNYGPNLDCLWLVDLGPGYDITLTFHKLLLENNEKCSYDWLIAQEGNTEDAPEIMRRCSDDDLSDVSTRGPMRISFVSDSDKEFEGFYLTYQAKDQNECLQPAVCHSNATCTNTVGSYHCTCLLSYTGDGKTCQWYRDFDECREEIDDCHADAECKNTLTYFECYCQEGFLGEGKNCTDIDECETHEKAYRHNCHQNASCTNTHGFFRCTCISVYTGDGVTCQDINECETNAHNCHGDGTCMNTDGSFGCECKVGYAGNGVFCSDIDECSDEIDNCHYNATCTNVKGSFNCSCLDGYSGDGVTCTDIDECYLNLHDCHTDGHCNNTEGAYHCSCNEGYSGDGVTCTVSRSARFGSIWKYMDECLPEPLASYLTCSSCAQSIAKWTSIPPVLRLLVLVIMDILAMVLHVYVDYSCE